MSYDQSNCLCNDNSTDKDSLGFEPYVDAIADFLTDKGTLAPITLSIEGEWGCGKSSFMKQLKKQLQLRNKLVNKGKEYFTVWFNCWRYEKEDDLWAAFALNLISRLSEQLCFWQRPLARFNLTVLRLKFKIMGKSSFSSNIVIFVILFLFAIFYSIPKFYEVISQPSLDRLLGNAFVILVGFLGSIIPFFYIGKDVLDVISNNFDFRKFESSPNYEERISFIEQFQSDFDKIIKAYAGDSRVFVFIDDLDRCETPKSAELMQALNLMINDNANVFFIIGMDRKVVSAAFAAKHENVYKYLTNDGLEYGYNFIEKFIQLPFRIPSPNANELSNFLTPISENESSLKQTKLVNGLNRLKILLNKLKVIKYEESSKKDSIPLQNKKEVMDKDDSQNIVAKVNTPNLNDKDCGDNEISQILEIVASSMGYNPRRMKQFTNAFRFQRFIGYKTGLFSYEEDTDPNNVWNCKKLAKYVAISIKWPKLISSLNSDITCLEQLQEYSLKSEENKKSNKENEQLKVFALRLEENKEINKDIKTEYDNDCEKWKKDKKLMTLLKHGCDVNNAEYTLSGLGFNKLLEISPEVKSSDLLHEIIESMEFVWISEGEFKMGSPESEKGRFDNEGPIHKVTIRNPFYIGKYPVTQKQWIAVMNYNPSLFKGEEKPVEYVSWNEVIKFIKTLNKNKGTDKYRLPSEAEWEYACRASTETRFYFGDDDTKLGDYAFYNSNSGDETHPVGQKKPNSWGLYDMHGNVWEWCKDNFHYYKNAPSNESAWEGGDSSNRICRGGGWNTNAISCRSANRFGIEPNKRLEGVGFRLVRDV